MTRPTLLPLSFLAFGQIVGWGTTFYLPSSLAETFGRELGLDRTMVFLGVTQMLVVCGLVSPTVGRWFDRYGAARFLPLGTLLIVAGLGGLLLRPGIAGWFAVWTAFGLAQAICLTLPMQIYVTRLDAGRARRRIGMLLVATGLSSSIFWPITAALEARLGWWQTIAIFAVAQAVVVLPMHLWIAVFRGDATAVADAEPTAAIPVRAERIERVPWGRRRVAEAVVVVAFAVQGFASWGLPLHMIDLFRDLGLDRGAAVAIAAVNGPAVLAARAFEIGWGGRWRPLDLTLLAMAVLAPCAVLLLLPVPATIATLAFTIGWSGANGLLSVMRITLPLGLFGSQGFGALSGRIALPTNLAFAAAPAAFAAVIGVGGPAGGAATAVVCGLIGAAAILVLMRIVRHGSGPLGENPTGASA